MGQAAGAERLSPSNQEASSPDTGLCRLTGRGKSRYESLSLQPRARPPGPARADRRDSRYRARAAEPMRRNTTSSQGPSSNTSGSSASLAELQLTGSSSPTLADSDDELFGLAPPPQSSRQDTASSSSSRRPASPNSADPNCAASNFQTTNPKN